MTLYRLTVQATRRQARNTRQDTLDGRSWRLSWYWSSVDDAWFLDIVSDGGEATRGIPVSTGLDILEPYRAYDVPPGNLFVQSTAGRAPTRDDFSDGVAVPYYERVS